LNCFNHPETPATSMCHSCNKALCYECRVEVGGVSSCKGACEERVGKIVIAVNTNIKSRDYIKKFVEQRSGGAE
jgi:hypothetical protein